MALTVNSSSIAVGASSEGAKIVTASLKMDNSYPAGGYPLSVLNTDLGQNWTYSMCQQSGASPNANLYIVDKANQKPVLLDDALAVVGTGSDQSAEVAILLDFIAY